MSEHELENEDVWSTEAEPETEQPEAPAEHPDPQAEHASPTPLGDGWFNRRPPGRRERTRP